MKHDRPKALFVKELKPNARRSLCADHLLAKALAVVVESQVPLPFKAARGGIALVMRSFCLGAGLSRTGGKLYVER